jgi:hypothetical protein
MTGEPSSHKTRYTNRVTATVAAARKVRGVAERPAAPERSGEGAGVLVWLPVAAAAGDPEGVDDDGDGPNPKNGAPDEGAGTETT